MGKKAKTDIEQIVDIMKENKQSRNNIHDEDTSQIAELKDTLNCHIKEQEINDKLMANDIQCNKDKLDKLMALIDLIPTLEKIAKNQENQDVLTAHNSLIVAKILKILGVISTIIAIVGGLLAAIWGGIQICRELMK